MPTISVKNFSISSQKMTPQKFIIPLLGLLLASCGVSSFTPGGYHESPEERQLAAFFRDDPKQKRKALLYDSRIGRAARAKAQDMARRGYFAHVDPDGNGANFLINRQGYRLPANYLPPRSANYVESLAGGHDTALETYRQFLTSASHRKHLLGENPEYARQTRYGIGYVHIPESKVGHYWVVMTAPPE